MLERVAAGERIVIAKAGKPVADLVPHRKADLVFGGLKGQVEYDDDAFVAADAEVLAMFDDDLGLDVPR